MFGALCFGGYPSCTLKIPIYRVHCGRATSSHILCKDRINDE
ncbi:hypothetical protein HHE02_11550 [Helicobacter heilmannii]|uniref:Uncharacterized protein n=1 Tax=Helicobacter heilmannii TaxID=35817 RepID=A0A0K2XJV6_HELHE|nr:hypothetical protein BN341_12320 [Helicobacter heilmannii ASB1.4]CRF46302.1 hypothetical protein HHE014_13000 [Helicobacter heilmannii]CRF47857.1 hypothetical protein HHE02_11550 [Helicobacter heilmannii]CRF48463.1 hypothetical protein HHE03_00100 [Helicobacter heilmannii]CRF50705.1 hypothetical protein HHE06_05480 [Helicobacter heilmannii]